MESALTLLRVRRVALLAAALLVSTSQGAPVDRTDTITRQPFAVKILSNGKDVTSSSPIASVKYNADGSGTRTLRNGQVVTGRWKFLNGDQTQIEVQGPEGASRWVIIELSDKVYRKANMDTGVEFIHLPLQ